MPGLSIYIHVYLQVLYKVMLQLRNSSSYGDDLRLYSSGLSREDTSILNTTGWLIDLLATTSIRNITWLHKTSFQIMNIHIHTIILLMTVDKPLPSLFAQPYTPNYN